MIYITEAVKDVQDRINTESDKLNKISDEYSIAFRLVRDYTKISEEKKRLENIKEGIQSLCKHDFEDLWSGHREFQEICKICDLVVDR